MSTLATGPLVRTSLSEMVYERLLDSILSGASPSGTEIVVSDVARELQVSPSPVREAVLRLAADGLVLNANNRRAMVITLTPEEVRDVFYVRQLLESGAADLAASRITKPQLAELARVADQCGGLHPEVMAAPDTARKREMLDLDNRFHLLIAEASGNEALRADILRYNRRVRVIQWLRLAPSRMRQAYDDHVAVLRALEAHDPARAREAMAHHIRLALAFVEEGVDAK